jgi:hypothetical protein
MKMKCALSAPPQLRRDAAIGDDSLGQASFYSAPYRPEAHIFSRSSNYGPEAYVLTGRQDQGHGRYFGEELPSFYGQGLYRRSSTDFFVPRDDGSAPRFFQATSGGIHEHSRFSAPPQTFVRHVNVDHDAGAYFFRGNAVAQHNSNFLVSHDVFQTGPRYFEQQPSAYYGRHSNVNQEIDYYATSVNRYMNPQPPNAVFFDVPQDGRCYQGNNFM